MELKRVKLGDLVHSCSDWIDFEISSYKYGEIFKSNDEVYGFVADNPKFAKLEVQKIMIKKLDRLRIWCE